MTIFNIQTALLDIPYCNGQYTVLHLLKYCILLFTLSLQSKFLRTFFYVMEFYLMLWIYNGERNEPTCIFEIRKCLLICFPINMICISYCILPALDACKGIGPPCMCIWSYINFYRTALKKWNRYLCDVKYIAYSYAISDK